MGLDVYLYHCPALAEANKAKAAYEAETDGFWAKYCDIGDDWKSIAKDEQDRRYEIYKAEKTRVAALFGLDAYGEHPSVRKIEEPSAKYPDHYFKVGYFRSSYNGGGINNVMHRYGLPDLYHAMGYSRDDDYEFTPDWVASRSRTVDLLASFKAIPHRDIDILDIGPNPFSDPGKLPTSETEARALLLNCLAAHVGRGKEDGAFVNGDGEWWLGQPLEVIGLIPGIHDSFTKSMFGKGMPVTYVAYRKKDNDWYEHALEIVIETCDYVLAQPDPQNHYIHWSS